ncbi:serine/threonine-protein phosphatase 7 long form-like protein [Cucumis melo var. makuwa]|uniref:Serine/threonine-protein phosphatase 7 long form-like protein n=2 Tax=Cucumis melo TaxID=3656 RepID=A0A5D3DZQ9_CUCMM|nr:serine/threonine-protein phosphatase 7 long form-like protein [Cucumis melo var. makuwa]
MLQDVVIQLGLLMDMEPVMGLLMHNWKQVREDFLRVVLPPDTKGQRLSIPWLVDVDVVSVTTRPKITPCNHVGA